MKKILYLAASVAAAGAICISCNKNLNDADEPNSVEKIPVAVKLLGCPESLSTKAALNTTNETAVSSVDVFAFRRDGSLDAHVHATSHTGVTLNCSTGEKSFVAVLNGNDLGSIASKTELLSKTTELTDNTLSKFVMVGEASTNVSAGTTVSIEVARIVARVGIASISTNFTSAAYQSQSFKVKRIFMINVAGDNNLGVSATPTLWFNKRDYQSSAADALLYSDVTDHTITNNSSWSPDEYFYVYPNPTVNDSRESTFSPRFTRLVIEAELGSKTYYYPIDIPGVQRNKKYTVSGLTITKPGALHPDDPITSEDCSFNIIIKDWEDGFDKEVTI